MKKVLLMCFMLIIAFTMVGCDNENTEFNKDQIKEELNTYINEIDKSETIENNLSYVNEIVSSIDNMKLTNEDKEQIIKNMKKQIDNIILNKDLEETIINDFMNYEHRNIYGNIIHPSTRCYGIYKEAVVMFILLPSDMEKSIVIDDINFQYNSDFAILVWYNHLFYSFEISKDIDELLSKEILSINDLRQIKENHDKWGNTIGELND